MSMTDENPKDPNATNYTAPGATLEMMLTTLVERYGWERLGQKINIRCFNYDPSIKSSLNFLRRTPWARDQVEKLYLWREMTGWNPKDDSK